MYNGRMSSVERLTVDFFSQALGLPVTGCRVAALDERRGYLADLYRVRLSGPGAPRSLIVKTASADPDRRALAERFGSYTNESLFYRHIRPTITVRTPHCYYNARDDFLLLLEDLGEGGTPDIRRGATGSQAMRVILALADLAPAGVVPGAGTAPAIKKFRTSFEAAAEDMATFVREQLSRLPAARARERALALALRYAGDSMRLLPRLLSLPQYFAHLDVRHENLRITDDSVGLLDWGECCLAPVGADLAGFMTACLTSRNRQALEDELLARYADRLGCGRAALFDGYRLSLLPGLYLAGLVLERGDHEEGLLLAQRSLCAIDDHKDFLARSFV